MTEGTRNNPDTESCFMQVFDFVNKRTKQEKEREFLRLMTAIQLILNRLGKTADRRQ